MTMPPTPVEGSLVGLPPSPLHKQTLDQTDRKSTTTISTLAVQSGNTRLVLALLKSGQRLDIKVVDLSPGLVYLGNSLEEAGKLSREQTKMMEDLKSKQNPVEELLKQADNLIVNQQPRAEVYAAMAESLGSAWRELNEVLEERKKILEQNYITQSYIKDNMTRVNELEDICNRINSQTYTSVEEVRAGLNQIDAAKKQMLETSMYSLQEGESLLGVLNKLLNHPTMDSRPNHLRISVQAAIEQVEEWLENLHDSRVRVSELYTLTRSRLNSRTSGLGVLNQIDNLHHLVAYNKDMIIKNDSLGNSKKEASQLLDATIQLEKEAQCISERSLKCVKMAQDLEGGEGNISMECSIRAYDVLEQSAEYQHILDNRKYLLNSAKEYFEVWEAAVNTLENIEHEVENLDVETGEELLVELTDKTREVINKILDEGIMLSEKAGNGPGTRGVRNGMDRIGGIGEKILKISTSMRDKLEKSNRRKSDVENRVLEIETWINQTLAAHSNISWTNRDELQKYKDMLGELLRGLGSRLVELESVAALDQLPNNLHQTVIRLKSLLETHVRTVQARIRITENMEEFINISNQLHKEIQNLDQRLEKHKPGADSTDIEQSRLLIEELYTQVCSIGRMLKEGLGVEQTDPASRILCASLENDINNINQVIETRLKEVHTRQTIVIERWTTMERTIHQTKKIGENLEKLRCDVAQILSLANEINTEIYPVFKPLPEDMSTLQLELEEKKMKFSRAKVIPERLNNLSSQIDSFLGIEDGEGVDKALLAEGRDIKSKLNTTYNTVKVKLDEYNRVLVSFTGILGKLTSLEKGWRETESKMNKQKMPRNVAEAEAAMQSFQTCKRNLDSIIQSIKAALAETHGDIGKLTSKQEFTNDMGILSKTLDKMVKEIESSLAEKNIQLLENLGFCEYTQEQQELTTEISNLLVTVRTKLMVTDKISSVNTLDGVLNPILERIQLTESRVNKLLQRGEKLLESQHSTAVNLGQTQTRDKWSSLQSTLEEQKQKLESAVQYFAYIEKAEAFIKQSTKKIIQWSEYIPGLKDMEKVTDILKELDNFTKKEKPIQDENITKITALAGKIYGNDAILRIKTLQMDTSEVINSVQALKQKFFAIKENLKREKEEEERRKQIMEETQSRVSAAEAAARTAKLEAEAATRAAKLEAEAAEKSRLKAEQAKANLEREGAKQAAEAAEALKKEAEALEAKRRAAELAEAKIKQKEAEQERLRMAEVEEMRRKEEEAKRREMEAEKQRQKEVEALQSKMREVELAEIKLKEIEAKKKELDAAEARIKEAEMKRKEEEVAFRRKQEAAEAEKKRLEAEADRKREAEVAEMIRLEMQAAELKWRKDMEASEQKRMELETQRRKIEEAEQRQKELEAESARQREAEAQERKRQAEEEKRRRQLEMEFADRKRKEIEAAEQRIKELEAEAEKMKEKEEKERKKREQEEVERRRREQEDRKRRREQEEMERQRREQEEAERRKREQEENDRRKLEQEQEEKRRKEQEELERQRKQEEIERRKREEEEAERRKKEIEEAEAKKREEEALKREQMMKEKRLKEEEEMRKKNMQTTIQTQTEASTPSPPRPPPPPVEEPAHNVPPVFTNLLEDKVIQEGQSCTLKAEVSGIPPPKVTWFKDGIPVQQNTDYVSVFDKGICLLSIEETLKEDSANWTVRASNPAGYAESHAKLTVLEAKLVEPPGFISRLEDISVREGQSLMLKCTVSGSPSVSWLKDGQCIDKSPNYIAASADGEVSLSKPVLGLNDSGVYTCKLTNSCSSVSASCQLLVEAVVPPILPRFLQPLVNLMVGSGDQILLECKVEGQPTPSIEWFCNSVPIKKSFSTKISYDGTTAKLVISNSKSSTSMGQYLCRAVNNAGEATSTATVTLKERTPEKIEPKEEEVRLEKPGFYVPLSNTSVKEYSSLVLSCTITGHPTPKVVWMRDGKQLDEVQDKVRISRDGGNHKLNILKVAKDHQGEYKVRASNSEGEAASSCQVSLEKSKPITESQAVQTNENAAVQNQNAEVQTHTNQNASSQTLTNQSASSQTLANQRTSTSSSSVTQSSFFSSSSVVKKRKETAPKFITSLQGKMVESGAQVVFEAVVDGFPAPRISWWKENLELRNGDEIKIHNLSKKSTLTISSVKESDGGKYSCRADSCTGTAESSTDLVVRRKQLSPVFLRRLQSQTLLVGHRLVAEVEVGGSPAPSVSWFFNGNPLVSSQVVRLVNHGNRFSVIINSVQAEDSGRYSVVAVNSAGQAESAADIAVFQEDEPPPRPPQPQQAEQESDQGFSRSVSPRGQSATPGRELGPETNTLRTLASHKRRSKPLPDLLPFPFTADEQIQKQRRNPAKVPKPSKFIKGEMYHSDYESDFEGRIPVKWKPSLSDSEEKDTTFRKIKLNLKTSSSSKTRERKKSPPCPHTWESHEDIDRLQSELKTKRNNFTADSIRSGKLTETLDQIRHSQSATTVFKSSVVSQLSMKTNSSAAPEKKGQDGSKSSAVKKEDQVMVSLKDPAVFETRETKAHSQSNLQQKSDFKSSHPDVHSQSFDQQLDQEIRQWVSQSFKSSSSQHQVSSSQSTSVTCSQSTPAPDDTDQVFYEATTKHSRMVKSPAVHLDKDLPELGAVPPPIPPKTKTSALTPSPSTRDASTSRSMDSTTEEISSQSTVQSKAEYIRVKEKVKHFEMKVEEDLIRQSLEDYSDYSGSVRPEDIPGAVRILPTPPGSRPASRSASRKNSLGRSSSTEPTRQGIFSPVNTPRSLQQSPCFARRNSDQPPPMFRPPPDNRSTDINPDIVSDSISRFRDYSYKMSSGMESSSSYSTLEQRSHFRSESNVSEDDPPPRPPLPADVVKSDTCSSMRSMFSRCSMRSCQTTTFTSPPPLESVSMADRDTTIEPSSGGEELKSPRMKRRSRSKADYTDDETDNDFDEVPTGRKSKTPTKEEERAPSRSPKLVKQTLSLDGYEADTETLPRRGSVKQIAARFQEAENCNPSPVPVPRTNRSLPTEAEPVFSGQSSAYIPPNWTSSTSQTRSQSTSRMERSVLRVNQEDIYSSEIHSLTSNCGRQQLQLGLQNADKADHKEPESGENEGGLKDTPIVFKPKKFVPGGPFSTEINWKNLNSEEKIPSKWTPTLNRATTVNQTSQHRKSGESSQESGNSVEPGKSDNQQSYSYNQTKRSIESGEKNLNEKNSLVYFKYDFGYEFGLVTPGTGSNKDDQPNEKPADS